MQWKSGAGQGPVMGGAGRGGVGRSGAAAGDARGADLFIGIKADDCSVNKAGPDTWEGAAWSNWEDKAAGVGEAASNTPPRPGLPSLSRLRHRCVI